MSELTRQSSRNGGLSKHEVQDQLDAAEQLARAAFALRRAAGKLDHRDAWAAAASRWADEVGRLADDVHGEVLRDG